MAASERQVHTAVMKQVHSAMKKKQRTRNVRIYKQLSKANVQWLLEDNVKKNFQNVEKIYIYI